MQFDYKIVETKNQLFSWNHIEFGLTVSITIVCVAFSLLMSVYRLQFTFGRKYSFFSDTWTTFAINKKKNMAYNFTMSQNLVI